MVAAALIAAGGSLAGGALSRIGQADANKANKKIAREQMAFQERMSNSAHQRQITDLKKAGLNPILSATSGASTPGGATATMGNEQAQNALNASSVGQMLAQTKNIMANTENVEAQTTAKKQDIILKQPAVTAVDKADISGIAADLGNAAKSVYQYGKEKASDAYEYFDTGEARKDFKDFLSPSQTKKNLDSLNRNKKRRETRSRKR